ncbi:hypothetical protein POTOM_031607 [Populus tomentosa]|uniref:ArsA HSP20-like domain-containing protein n=1 Tax=Populus tomentosa TaxID=118781 RepID=A0A8X8CSP9_POPTO|nr:hypothetical protein POTOM_031607 [Populus tomentosa]
MQCRGGSELVAEAGDQRRVICLPTKIRGKVGGAKFVDRSLVITVRRWDFNGYQLLFAFFILVCPRLKLIFYDIKERRLPAIQSRVDFIASHQRYAT